MHVDPVQGLGFWDEGSGTRVSVYLQQREVCIVQVNQLLCVICVVLLRLLFANLGLGGVRCSELEFRKGNGVQGRGPMLFERVQQGR